MVEALDDGLDGLFGHQRGVLADGSEVDEIDPDMAVNIEHEDASYSRIEGLAIAAENLRTAAAKM